MKTLTDMALISEEMRKLFSEQLQRKPTISPAFYPSDVPKSTHWVRKLAVHNKRKPFWPSLHITYGKQESSI